MEIIITLIVIIAILLVLVILAQNSKGGGLTSQFGGSGASNIIGVKKTSDLLEKITWGLAISLCVLSIATTILSKQDSGDPFSTTGLDKAKEQGAPVTASPTLDQSNSDNSGGGIEALEAEPAAAEEESTEAETQE